MPIPDRPIPGRPVQPGAGVLFLVVGPSGVGKDTLIDAARATLASDRCIHFARRVVTRPRAAGGEDFEAMGEADFRASERDGAFAVTWRAHGLAYGIRREALAPLAHGEHVVVNASRRAIGEFCALAACVVVLAITAPPALVHARLKARGREDAADVAQRLARQVPLAGTAPVVEIANDGTVDEGTQRFLDALAHASRTHARGS